MARLDSKGKSGYSLALRLTLAQPREGGMLVSSVSKAMALCYNHWRKEKEVVRKDKWKRA
jgi:hypothetical protein